MSEIDALHRDIQQWVNRRHPKALTARLRTDDNVLIVEIRRRVGGLLHVQRYDYSVQTLCFAMRGWRWLRKRGR